MMIASSLAPLDLADLAAFRARVVGGMPRILAGSLAVLFGSAYLFAVAQVDGVGENVHMSMEASLARMGSAQATCDLAANVVVDGAPNCFDHRGFRIVREKGYRIYSLRYARPLFVFGIEQGMTYGNQHVSEELQRSEMDSFMRYLSQNG